MIWSVVESKQTFPNYIHYSVYIRLLFKPMFSNYLPRMVLWYLCCLPIPIYRVLLAFLSLMQQFSMSRTFFSQPPPLSNPCTSPPCRPKGGLYTAPRVPCGLPRTPGTPAGLQRDSTRTPGRFWDAWDTAKMYLESWWSPCGIHVESW